MARGRRGSCRNRVDGIVHPAAAEPPPRRAPRDGVARRGQLWAVALRSMSSRISSVAAAITGPPSGSTASAPNGPEPRWIPPSVRSQIEAPPARRRRRPRAVERAAPLGHGLSGLDQPPDRGSDRLVRGLPDDPSPTLVQVARGPVLVAGKRVCPGIEPDVHDDPPHAPGIVGLRLDPDASRERPGLEANTRLRRSHDDAREDLARAGFVLASGGLREVPQVGHVRERLHRGQRRQVGEQQLADLGQRQRVPRRQPPGRPPR